jgi:hypothetical protein
MNMKSDKLIADIEEEVKTILSPDFHLSARETRLIPHSSDGAITFPNLDDRTQGVKLLETAVLFVDMRRSTELPAPPEHNGKAILSVCPCDDALRGSERRTGQWHNRRPGHGAV